MRANEFITESTINESSGLPSPGTYEQEYGRFQSKGPKRLTAMTNEALDSQPYEYTTQISDDYRMYKFNTDNNLKYDTCISIIGGEPNSGIEVEFNLLMDGDRYFGIQNTGDARRVLATVIDIIKKYAIENKPRWIAFTARERSRIQLYDALVKRLDRELPDYELKSDVMRWSGKKYILKLKEK